MIKLDHTALYVSDLESAKNFFVKYFDAQSSEQYHNPNTNFKSYFLSFGNQSRLEIMTRPELPQSSAQATLNPFSSGFHRIAFSLGGKKQVDALTQILKDDGYEIVSGPRTIGDGCYESCILGPENNYIEITE